MDLKKQLGAIAVLSMVLSGTGAGAGQSAPLPTRGQTQQFVPSETFTLKPGEVKDVVAKEPERAMIEDPDVVDIAPPEPSGAGKMVFHVKGRTAGSTSVTIWSKDGTHRTYAFIVKA